MTQRERDETHGGRASGGESSGGRASGEQSCGPEASGSRAAAEARAHGKDVDGLKTLPGVHSASGEEKAGTGEVDDEGRDPASAHVASATYPGHPPVDGPPRRHR